MLFHILNVDGWNHEANEFNAWGRCLDTADSLDDALDVAQAWATIVARGGAGEVVVTDAQHGYVCAVGPDGPRGWRKRPADVLTAWAGRGTTDNLP